MPSKGAALFGPDLSPARAHKADLTLSFEGTANRDSCFRGLSACSLSDVGVLGVPRATGWIGGVGRVSRVSPSCSAIREVPRGEGGGRLGITHRSNSLHSSTKQGLCRLFRDYVRGPVEPNRAPRNPKSERPEPLQTADRPFPSSPSQCVPSPFPLAVAADRDKADWRRYAPTSLF